MPEKQTNISATVENGKSDPIISKGTKYIFSFLPKFAPFAIIIFTAVLYSQAVFNGLTSLDDAYYVNNNPFLRDFSWHGISAIFTSFYSCNYHPFTTLTYLFEFRFFGLDPMAYHLLNVLLHLFNTWFVFILAERLSGKKITALVVSVLFAVHPMHVESVAWVAERKDVLYSFFYLLSLLYYLSYIRSGYRNKYYLGMCLFFIASLFSKSAAVSLPVLLVAIDIYTGRTINAKPIVEKIPLLLLSVLFGILNIMAQTADGCIDAIGTSFGFINRIFLSTSALASYIIKLVVPYNLSSLYYFPTMTGGLLPWGYYASLPFVLFLLFLAWLAARRSSLRNEIIFGISFFLITIFLMLQVISIGYAFIAERYTYLSYIGLFYIAGQWISKIAAGKWKNAVIGIFTAVLILFSVITWIRIGVWTNNETLYEDIVAKNTGSPYCFYPYFILAMEKYKEGDFQDALQNYNESISLNPGYAVAYNNRGLLYMQLNEPNAALNDFNRAILLDPYTAIRYNNRASIKASIGDFKGAIVDYNSFLKMKPNNARAYADLGMAHLNLKDSSTACKDWQKSLELGNNDAQELIQHFCH